MRSAIGFRVHSGWAAAVTLSGAAGSPAVLDRRRIQLVGTFTYAFRQPYHTAEKLPLSEANSFVEKVRAESCRLALDGIRAVRKDLAGVKCRIESVALLLSSARELPALERILSSHALIHTADGELFRDAIRQACSRAKIKLACFRERELLADAAERLACSPAALERRIASLGKSLGPPWTQDQKLAALAAWLSLAR